GRNLPNRLQASRERHRRVSVRTRSGRSPNVRLELNNSMQTSATRTTHELSFLGFSARITAPPGILRELRPLLPISPIWDAPSNGAVATTFDIKYSGST